MNDAVAQAVEVQADCTVRGPDFDTAMIGPVTASLIDADRLVRLDWKNGFPNWALYRTALAGDTLHADAVREWVIGFAHAYCSTTLQKRAYSDALAGVVALDALHMLYTTLPLEPPSVLAKRLAVDPKTYARCRNTVFRFLKATTDEYWIRLGAAYRYVILAEKRC